MLWTNKYSPKKISDLFHPSSKTLVTFIDKFKFQKKKALLLYGPPGCGKTSAVIAVAKDKDMELIEVNASDFRNTDSLNSSVGNALNQRSLFAKNKLILVDEVDGLAGREDRGGISTITSLIKKSSFPIICCANNVWESKLSGLRKVCTLVPWDPPSTQNISDLLASIVEKEKLNVDDKFLKSIARRSGGDVRAAVTDLQILISSNKLNKEGIDNVDERSQTDTMFNALVKILKSSDPEVALSSLQNVNEDFNESLLWIEENIPLEYKGKELADAFDKLSRADVFIGRIRRWQYWRFLSYANSLMTAGVALSKNSKKGGFTKYERPKRILKYWIAKSNRALRKSVCLKIGHALHCSAKKANVMLHHFKLMAQNNMDLSSLDIDGAELDWLKK